METHHKFTGVHLAFHLVAIVVGGFILFNLGFVFAAFVTLGTRIVLGPVLGSPLLGRLIFLLLISVLSGVIFKSKLPVVAKATYMTLPLITLLIIVGITLFGSPVWITIFLDGLIIGAVLFFLKRNHFTWQFYFAVFYVTSIMLFIGLTGLDI